MRNSDAPRDNNIRKLFPSLQKRARERAVSLAPTNPLAVGKHKLTGRGAIGLRVQPLLS